MLLVLTFDMPLALSTFYKIWFFKYVHFIDLSLMTNFVTFDCDLSEGKHATLGVRDSYLLAGTRGPGLSSNRSRSQLSDGEWAVSETKRESRREKIVQTFRDKCETLREIVNTENEIRMKGQSDYCSSGQNETDSVSGNKHYSFLVLMIKACNFSQLLPESIYASIWAFNFQCYTNS